MSEPVGYRENEIRLMRLTTTFQTQEPVDAETARAERRGWLATVDALTARLAAAEALLREIGSALSSGTMRWEQDLVERIDAFLAPKPAAKEGS